MKHIEDIYTDIKKLSKEDIKGFLKPKFMEQVFYCTEIPISAFAALATGVFTENPYLTALVAVAPQTLTYLGLRGLKLRSYLLEEDSYVIDRIMQTELPKCRQISK